METEKWEEFQKLIEEIENSTGQKVIEEVDRLKRGLRMVKRNKDELIKVAQVLKQPMAVPKLWSVNQRLPVTIWESFIPPRNCRIILKLPKPYRWS